MESYDLEIEEPLLLETVPGRGDAILTDSVTVIQGLGADLSTIVPEALEFARLMAAPKLNQVYIGVGNRLLWAGHADEALRHFEIALQIDPNDAIAWLCRGIAYHQSGQLREALRDIDHALQLAPDEPVALYNRGVVLEKQGDDAAALEDYSHAIERSPAFAEAYVARGRLYIPYGAYEEALVDLSKAIELSPQMAQALALRGIVFRDIGDYPRALNDLELVSRLTTDQEPYQTIRNVVQLLANLTELIKQTPDNPDLYMQRAALCLLIGNPATALLDAEEAQRLGHTASQEMIANVWQSLILQATEAIGRAGSPDTIRLILRRFPFLSDPTVRNLLLEFSERLDLGTRASYEEHLSWLDQQIDTP